MTYEIRRTHRQDSTDSKLLHTVETSREDFAREVFTDYAATVLDQDTDHFHYVRFIEKGGGFVNEAIAYPQAEDILPQPPAWYKGAGFYDESENLILRYDAGRDSGSEADVAFLLIGDYRYELTALQPKAQAPENDQLEELTEDQRAEHIRLLDELREQITSKRR